MIFKLFIYSCNQALSHSQTNYFHDPHRRLSLVEYWMQQSLRCQNYTIYANQTDDNQKIIFHHTPCFNEVEMWVYWFHLVRLYLCPSVDRIVSALYLQQYSSDPVHICTSSQAISEGVSRVKFVSKLKKLTLSSFDLGSNMTQCYG